MIKVVTGAGASGKSSFAESLLEQSEAKRKIYAATMIVWDDECRARVKKHRQMREKKGFETAERPVDLGELFVPEDGAVLVECMSNLAANEMYREDVGMESCAELRAAQAGYDLFVQSGQSDRKADAGRGDLPDPGVLHRSGDPCSGGRVLPGSGGGG